MGVLASVPRPSAVARISDTASRAPQQVASLGKQLASFSELVIVSGCRVYTWHASFGASALHPVLLVDVYLTRLGAPLPAHQHFTQW